MVMDIKSNLHRNFQLLLVIGLILFLFAMTSCGGPKETTKAPTASESKTPSTKVSSNIPSLDNFLDEFENATLSHNSVTILTYLDKAYKKEQLDVYCNKNTDSFLNKFYSNNQISDGKSTIQYRSITKISRLKFQFQNQYYIVSYRIEAGIKQIEVNFTVFSQLEKGALSYKIYGPVG